MRRGGGGVGAAVVVEVGVLSTGEGERVGGGVYACGRSVTRALTTKTAAADGM